MLTKTRVFFILIALSLVTSQAISPISGGGGGGTPGGSTTQVQYNNAGTFDGITGATTNGTTLTLVAPILGTPASGVMTNVTGTAAGLTAGNVITDANLTGVITSSGNATSIASQTGTGTKFVVDTGPTLVTPNIGTPSAGVLTNATGLPISTGVSGLGTGVATFLATPSGANLASALTSAIPTSKGGTALTALGAGVGGNGGLLNTDVSTSGGAVLVNGPLGTPSSGTLTNATGYTVAHMTGFGSGVATALGFDTGLANAFVVNGGALGTPSSGTLTAATGLPISTGVSGLGTGVATALGFNTGSANAFVVNGGALGTPSSGTVTNLTGTASININGTVGATTPGTGAFTTVSTTGTLTLGTSAQITGGAGNMTITAGTGNSRTMALQSTTSGGTATTFLTGNADQTTTFAGNIIRGSTTIGSNVFGMGGQASLFQTSGNDIFINAINSSTIFHFRNSSFSDLLTFDLSTGKNTKYNAIATAGNGLVSIVKASRVTAQSAANSSICTYTAPASDGSYEVSMNLNASAVTAMSATLNCDYTDEGNTARTMIFPVQSLAGNFITGGLITATGPYETPVMHIRVKASTVLTLYTSTGTYTGVTYTAEGIIKQTQ